MANGPIIISILIVLLAAGGCTQPSPVQPTPAPTVSIHTVYPVATTSPVPQFTNRVSENTVRIQNFAFIPENITVEAGSIVRWVNGDQVPHRIQFEDKHFSTMLLGSSQSGSQKFDEPGVYPYISLTHPEMRGMVIVE